MMLELAQPFSPVAYFLHTVVGSLGVLAALMALAVTKGSRGHILAGRGFALAALVAALTAIHFSFTAPSPLAIASSLIMLALVPGAILALRPASPGVRRIETVTTILMALASGILVLMGGYGLAAVAGIAPLPQGVPIPPLGVVLLPLAYAAFPVGFLVGDVRFRRAGARRTTVGIRRHLSRMAFALALAIHAPVVSFGDELALPPMVAFFGPFILWPAALWRFRHHPRVRARAELPT